jgi:hypothetical protein
LSIYPVRLAEWFPAKPKRNRPGETWPARKERRHWHETAKFVVEQSTCCVCGKKPQYRYAWGMHAIPWGYGTEEIWCSKKCLQKPDRSEKAEVQK